MRFYNATKKILSLLCVATTSLCAQEETKQSRSSTTGSIYVGMSFGPGYYNGHYCAQEGVNTLYFQSGGDFGFVGGVAGIDKKIDSFYMALEGGGYYGNSNEMIGLFTNKLSIPDHVIYLKNRFLADGIIKFGFCSKETIIYGSYGLTAGRWCVELHNDSARSWNKGMHPSANLDFHRYLFGDQLGAGVRFPFYFDWLMFDMQYTYNRLPEIKIELNDLNSRSPWLHKVNVTYSSVKFSLDIPLYRF